MTTETVGYFLTKRIAEHKLALLEAEQRRGRSSGWKRIDYSIKRSKRKVYRWQIIARSS